MAKNYNKLLTRSCKENKINLSPNCENVVANLPALLSQQSFSHRRFLHHQLLINNFWVGIFISQSHINEVSKALNKSLSYWQGWQYNDQTWVGWSKSRPKEVTDESFGFSTGLVLSIANLGKMFLLLFSITPLVDAVLLNLMICMMIMEIRCLRWQQWYLGHAVIE